MRSIYKGLLPFALLVFIILSCGAGRRDRPQVEKDSRTAAEAGFDPLGYEGDRDIVTADVPRAVESEESDEVLPPRKSEPEKHDSQYFAVQLFASKSNTEARDFVTSIESLFEDEIKIDYQAPYYRVCVGRSSGYEDAEVMLKKVNAMGFPKAWLVKLNK